MIMLLIFLVATIDAPVILIKHMHAPKCVSMYIPYYTMSQLYTYVCTLHTLLCIIIKLLESKLRSYVSIHVPYYSILN